MTPRFHARQNKIRLIAVFLFIAGLSVAFQVLKSRSADPEAAMAGGAASSDPALFMGLRHASAREILAVLPEAQGRPMLLEFSSRLCHDCQRLAPVLRKVTGQHPGVYFRKIDVMEDKDKYPALFRAFKPVSVPMMVFIDGKGEIRNVLYNYQKPAVIAAAIDTLEKQSR